MVATAPGDPKISYFTVLGLNGFVSLASPLPGLVVSVRPNSPCKRSTQKMAIPTATRMTIRIHTLLKTRVRFSLSRSERFRVGAGATEGGIVALGRVVSASRARLQVSLL